MLEDFVGPADPPSAIRLNSTARSLGILCGPVVGSALLLGLGPVHGIWANVAIYVPLTAAMARTKFTGHRRDGVAFAFSHDYVTAALLLVIGGIANLAAVGANGMRIGSGFTVGILGAIVGLRVSLGISASALCVGTVIVADYLAISRSNAVNHSFINRK